MSTSSSLSLKRKNSFLLSWIFLIIFLCTIIHAKVDISIHPLRNIHKVLGLQPDRDPHIPSLSHAIHTQRRILHDRIHTNSREIHTFLACGAYQTTSTQLQDFISFHLPINSSQPEIAPYYHSAQENIFCVTIHGEYTIYEALHDTSHVNLWILEPFPSILRLDGSITQLWPILGAIDSEEDELEYGFDSTSRRLSDYSGSRKLRMMSESVNHPLLKEFLREHVPGTKNKRSLGISLVFSRPTKSIEREELVQNWRKIWNQMEMTEIISHLRHLESFYHDTTTSFSSLNEEKEEKQGSLHEEEEDSLPFYRRKLTPFPKLEEILRNDFQSDSWRRGRIAEGRSLTRRLHSYLNVNETMTCNPANWAVSLHRYGAYISLPASLLNIDFADSALLERLTACITLFATPLLSDSRIARIGLGRPMKTQNNVARQIIQSGGRTNDLGTYFKAGLNGTGFVVGVADTGIDEMHCYFRDYKRGLIRRSSLDKLYTDKSQRKIVQYLAYSGSGGDYSSGHGTHVAGSIAGYCADEYTESGDESYQRNLYMGMAPGAQLAFFDIGMNNDQQELVLPSDLSGDLFPPAYNAGARLYSNSWGGGYMFDGFCIDTDSYLYNQDDMLIFYAAGNSGSQGGETVLSPAISKNAVAVGCSINGHSSSSNIDYIASFSSHGPTLEGRIKPDIVAPGYSVLSAKGISERIGTESCSAEYKAGTSMSTPIVAGNAVLILEYFSQPQYWASYCNQRYAACRIGAFKPTGYLLKALVLHSGVELSGYDGRGASSELVTLEGTPDIYQGYGRMDLRGILPLGTYQEVGYSLFVDTSSLATLTELRYTVTISSSKFPLRVTLSWFDPPNTYFASKLLLHDLDLLVRSPSGEIYYGNGGSQSGPSGSGGSGRDELNNNEQVVVPSPSTGVWKVSVQAKQLSEGGYQKFGLVITADGEVSPVQETQALALSLLQRCAATNAYDGQPSTPRMEVGVSLWSRVSNEGWARGDSFSVTPTDATHESSTLRDYFRGHHAYEVRDLCLPAGCYTAELHTSNKTIEGTQLSLPACGVYLSPTAVKQTFCISNSTQHDDVINGGNKVSLFHSGACTLPCWNTDHFSVALTVLEEAGSGWSGTYYTIYEDTHRTPPVPYNSEDSKNSSRSTASISKNDNFLALSDSMEWGFAEDQRKCLPPRPACYALKLTLPLFNEEFPILQLRDAIGMKYFRTFKDEDFQCEFSLSRDIQVATFCVTPDIPFTEISFYADPDAGVKAATDGGVGYGTGGKDLWKFLDTAKPIGSCALHSVISRPKNFEELSPTSGGDPDDDGESSLDNISLQEYSHPFSCLSTCEGYPGHLYFATSTEYACDFLSNLLEDCDAFNLAYGRCSIPECMSQCSIESFCYYSIGATVSCVYDKWDESLSEFSSSMKLCTSKYSSAFLTNSPINNPMVIEIVVISIIVIILLIVIGCAWRVNRKNATMIERFGDSMEVVNQLHSQDANSQVVTPHENEPQIDHRPDEGTGSPVEQPNGLLARTARFFGRNEFSGAYQKVDSERSSQPTANDPVPLFTIVGDDSSQEENSSHDPSAEDNSSIAHV